MRENWAFWGPGGPQEGAIRQGGRPFMSTVVYHINQQSMLRMPACSEERVRYDRTRASAIHGQSRRQPKVARVLVTSHCCDSAWQRQVVTRKAYFGSWGQRGRSDWVALSMEQGCEVASGSAEGTPRHPVLSTKESYCPRGWGRGATSGSDKDRQQASLQKCF